MDGAQLPEAEYFFDNLTILSSFDNLKATTTDFVFSGSAYNTLKAKFLDNPLGRLSRTEVLVYDDCCGSEKLIFEGEIQGKDIEFCAGECEIKATVTEKNRLLDCIKMKIVGDNLERTGHPVVAMNQDSSVFEDIVINYLRVLLIVLVPVLGFLEIVEEIVNFIRRLGFGRRRRIDIPSLDNLREIMQALDQIYYYPSPYVRTYVRGVLDKCGTDYGQSFAFQSSIFNNIASPYYNTVYFSAKYRRGWVASSGLSTIQENDPLNLASEFLDQVKKPFNAIWRVRGNTLILEPKAYFLANGTITDLSNEQACYTFQAEDLPSHGWLKYADDSLDASGNEQVGQYDFLQSWNEPPNPVQRGRKEFLFDFGRAKVGRFTGLIGGGDLGTIIKMSRQTASLPKLLLMDSGGNLSSDQSPLYGATLYTSFFDVENPRTNSLQGFDWSLDLEMDCTNETLLPGDRVQLDRGVAYISEIEKNYSKRTVTIRGQI